jgi:RHS repeat-associated protein
MSQLEKVEMKHQVNSSRVSYRNHGSVRVVMAADGTVEQVNHYYAFGGLMGDSSGGDVQKYKYNGKELDRFLGWDMLDYGARWYDSKLQCWSTVDPLAEKYYHISPYVYCADNPVKYVYLQEDSISLDLQAINAILFLRGLPHSHMSNGEFIYNRQFNVMRRLGYDYVDR